jgi:hypothetical protein
MRSRVDYIVDAENIDLISDPLTQKRIVIPSFIHSIISEFKLDRVLSTNVYSDFCSLFSFKVRCYPREYKKEEKDLLMEFIASQSLLKFKVVDYISIEISRKFCEYHDERSIIFESNGLKPKYFDGVRLPELTPRKSKKDQVYHI